MKKIKNALVIFLSVIMALSSGCGAGAKWIYELDGEAITAGMYINYMVAAMAVLEENEYEAHSDDADYALPTTKDLLKMTTDGMLNSEWVKNEAQKSSAEYYVVERMFAELGLTLTDSEISLLNSYAEYAVSANSEFYDVNGVSKASILQFQTNIYKREKVFNALYAAEDGERYVPEDILKSLFDTRYLKAETMYIPREETAEEDETAIDNRELAEEYVSRLAAGESIISLIYEYELSAAQTDEEKAAVEQFEESDVILILEQSEENLSQNAVVKHIADAPVGEVRLYEDELYFYIYRRLDLLENPLDFDSYKNDLLSYYKLDEFNEYIRGLAQDISLTVNKSALNRYKPESIRTDMLS